MLIYVLDGWTEPYGPLFRPRCLVLELFDVLGVDAEGTEGENILIGSELDPAADQEGIDGAFSSPLYFVVLTVIVFKVEVAVVEIFVFVPPVILVVLSIIVPLFYLACTLLDDYRGTRNGAR